MTPSLRGGFIEENDSLILVIHVNRTPCLAKFNFPKFL